MKPFIPDIYNTYYNTKDIASLFVSPSSWSNKAAVIAMTFNNDKLILHECDSTDEAKAFLQSIIDQ